MFDYNLKTDFFLLNLIDAILLAFIFADIVKRQKKIMEVFKSIFDRCLGFPNTGVLKLNLFLRPRIPRFILVIFAEPLFTDKSRGRKFFLH